MISCECVSQSGDWFATKKTTGVNTTTIVKTTNKLSTEVGKVGGGGCVTRTVGGSDNSKETSVGGAVNGGTVTQKVTRRGSSTGKGNNSAGRCNKTQAEGPQQQELRVLRHEEYRFQHQLLPG